MKEFKQITSQTNKCLNSDKCCENQWENSMTTKAIKK